MIIYKTINLVNGKIYIGKDKYNNPKYLGSGKKLKLAIEKYGSERFKKEILEECNSIVELNTREIYWIAFFNSTDRTIGYNIALGGTGGDTISNHPNNYKIRMGHSYWMLKNCPTKNKKYTQEEIEKRKKSFVGKYKGENNPNYGSKRSDKSKKIMSEKRKKWHANLSQEKRLKISKKISESNKGKPGHVWTDMEKKVMSEYMKKNPPFKGKKHSEETRGKISVKNKKPKSEETKLKLSKASIGNTSAKKVKIEIDGIIYESMLSASNKIGVHLSTIRNRIKSNNVKFKNYKICKHN